MTQYAILTDLNRCVGCLGCSVACKVVNGVEIGSFWNKCCASNRFPDSEGAQFPDVYTYFAGNLPALREPRLCESVPDGRLPETGGRHGAD